MKKHWKEVMKKTRPLTFIENFANNLQAEFDETIGSDSEKKLFITSLTRIFAILLSTRADTAEKIWVPDKGCSKSNNKTMVRTKLTARSWPKTSRITPWPMRKRHMKKDKRNQNQNQKTLQNQNNFARTKKY